MSKNSKGSLAAPDGKHYWNVWTSNYRRSDDGYIQHAFCEEDRTGRTLCGRVAMEGGGLSFPHELRRPSCKQCQAVMERRGALLQDTQPSPDRSETEPPQ